MSKRIILTGGGTAGHVNPNIALLPGLKERGYEVFYIGSEEGMEHELINDVGIPYFSVATGKLRRYLSAKNVSDAFRVVKGVSDAIKILKTLHPDVIFSKGGYVSVPVVLGAKRLGIPVIIHESDVSPGLANKISFRFCEKICASFPETLEYLPEDKAVLTGTPIRAELKEGSKEAGLKLCGFTGEKPVLSVMGGSSGAAYINDVVRQSLGLLLPNYDIIHLCGKGNLDSELSETNGYAQFEYVTTEMKDIFAATDIMVSRSGANAVFELLATKTPNILIPLPTSASRGDQILNARSFERDGFSHVLLQEDLTPESLAAAAESVLNKKDAYIIAMEAATVSDPVGTILGLIDSYLK